MAIEILGLRRFRARYDSANVDNPLRVKLIVAGEKAAPASGTITIYAPGSTVALVTTAAMTLHGASELEYAIDTTTEASWPASSGYRAEIAITDGASVVHSRVVMFDVVRFLLNVPLDTDQLSQLDEIVGAMTHGGGDDMAPIIEACRDELQLLVEAKANEDGELVETMILDSTSLAAVFRRMVLAAIFEEHGDDEKAKRHRDRFEQLLLLFLGNARYDRAGTGEEDDGEKPLHLLRFTT